MAAIGIGWLYHINNMSKTARHHFIHTLMDNRDLDEAINDHMPLIILPLVYTFLLRQRHVVTDSRSTLLSNASSLNQPPRAGTVHI